MDIDKIVEENKELKAQALEDKNTIEKLNIDFQEQLKHHRKYKKENTELKARVKELENRKPRWIGGTR